MTVYLYDRKATWYKHALENWLRLLGAAASGELPGKW